MNYLQGRGRFSGHDTLLVSGADGRQSVSFDHAIIATGSRPARIPSLWLDSERMMDSTTALELPDVPPSLLVIGGGYIGLELGSVYAALGSAVTVVEMLPGLLPGADRDLVGSPGPAGGGALRQGARQHARGGAGGNRRRHCRHARHPRRQGDRDLRQGADERRAHPQHQGPGPGTPRHHSSTNAASSRWTSSAAPPMSRSSRSATWPVSRGWRTRPPTRGAPPPRQPPA